MMAADIFAERLQTDDWSRRMLFPEQNHCIWLIERELGRAKFNANFLDRELNYEQQVPPPPPARGYPLLTAEICRLHSF